MNSGLSITSRTQVGAAAAAVAAAGDVEEAASVAVGIGAVGHAA